MTPEEKIPSAPEPPLATPAKKEAVKEGTYYKIYVIITATLAAGTLLVATLTYIRDKAKLAAETNQHSDTTHVRRDSALVKDTGHTKIVTVTPSNPHTKQLLLPQNKMLLPPKVDALTHPYQDEFTANVLQFFAEKGYSVGEADVNTNVDIYKNLISCKVTLSSPDTIDRHSDGITLNYEVTVLLRFFDKKGKPCSQLPFRQTVPTDRYHEEKKVIIQGLATILDKLKKTTNFPFCNSKQ